MNPLASRSFLLTCGVLAFASALAPAMAQDNASAAPALDLSVPATPIEFANASDYSNLPPGASPGDPPWRPFANGLNNPDNAGSDWQVHGDLAMGVGWSKNGGNSNWQAADISMNKTYATDDGGTGHVGVNISIGQYDGPVFGPGYGSGYYYGPGPAPMSGPMPGAMPGPMPAPGPMRR